MLEKAVEQIQQKADSLVEELSKEIRKLPDNREIRKKKSNCYEMSSKNLSIISWDPFYYDFKYQYEFIIQIIRKTKFEYLVERLRHIIESGCYRKGARAASVNYRFHDEVINKLKTVMDNFGFVLN